MKHQKPWSNCVSGHLFLARKLAIYCNYLEHSTYNGFVCARATKEGNNLKPTVIPSKSHSAAVFIYLEITESEVNNFGRY